MSKTSKIISIAILMILFFTSVSCAFDLNGSFSSEFYFWEDSAETHIRPYQSLQANSTLWKNEKNQKLSFNTYLRWKTDLQDKLPSDPQLFVYDAYFKFTNLPKKTRIYLGRQYIYTSAGSALIDGARINLTFRKTSIDIFNGVSVNSLDPEEIQSFSDFLAVGGRLSYKPVQTSKIGLNWMYRENNNSVTTNRLALDFQKKLNKWGLYSRIGYNIESKSISELLGRVRYSYKKWYFSGEYYYREPSVPHNSVFSIIDFKKYKNIRIGLQRKLSDKVTLLTRFNVSLYESENLYLGGLGIQTSKFSIMWQHQNGYGGERDGISGYINFPVYKNWQTYASANLSRYKVQDMQDERNDAYSTQIGVVRKFDKNIKLRFEWQLIRNAIMSDDSRFRIKLTKGFSFTG